MFEERSEGPIELGDRTIIVEDVQNSRLRGVLRSRLKEDRGYCSDRGRASSKRGYDDTYSDIWLDYGD